MHTEHSVNGIITTGFHIAFHSALRNIRRHMEGCHEEWDGEKKTLE